ncbi:SDR family oxidoreductase [Kutzneria viridogrisea]|uniref:NAD(P)-dependent dehydrogenase (Short-subunit alcohol dehydrogenase family) n=1 Tax=Kutzneria viridogrisea TaxID=47990 RepID=A0ABR6BMC2_9PSEU|nr:NAD(P)-dependent dehydrogenase (short-subunit alcohol dehydrogenase family) [Kutzneria viridogrisea]
MNRSVIVTGAGRGLGRAHALAFAAAGYGVIVNDVDAEQAERVVDEIAGQAVACAGDVADWDGAANLVDRALSTFGRLDVLVNNAGFVRDRMIVSTGEAEWDSVVRVHLKGHFAPLRHAAAHWREQHKAGRPVAARVINTSSGAGLLGSVGQCNYSAAKAGILGLTLVAAAELARYGVTVNAIAPAARTRMTEQTFAELMAAPIEGFDAMAPENVSPLVVWLGSEQSGSVTGQVFEVEGGRVGLLHGWQRGRSVRRDHRWTPEELGPALLSLLDGAPAPLPVYGA